jgi:drug/metabolite transporter (DMT)-like permease
VGRTMSGVPPLGVDSWLHAVAEKSSRSPTRNLNFMLVVVVGAVSALVFGAADFLGGLATKRIAAVRVTAITGVVGLAVLLALLPLLGGAFSPEAALLGALSGVTGSIAIVLLYACLAIGPMSILSPLTAVVSAVVPLTAGLLRGETLSTIGYVAIGVALVAVLLVGFVPDPRARRPSLRGVLMAIGSGALIGAFLIIIDLTPDDSGLIPLVFNRATSSLIMFAVVGVLLLTGRGGSGGWRRGLALAVACGVVDAAANAGLLLGLRLGELSIVSVLTALYPAGTIILAAIVLRERVAIVQYIGLALAITAAAMLALA